MPATLSTMFLLFYSIAASQLHPIHMEPVQAHVRLLDSVVASEDDWVPKSNARQHERIERLPDGSQIRLRITDHE